MNNLSKATKTFTSSNNKPETGGLGAMKINVINEYADQEYKDYMNDNNTNLKDSDILCYDETIKSKRIT